MYFIGTVHSQTITAQLGNNGHVTYQSFNVPQNTQMFTLFGDGSFSTVLNPTHVFAPNPNGYTTETYFAIAYDQNLPPKKTVNTGPIMYTPPTSGTSPNPTVNMTGEIDVFISWAPSLNEMNFYILAFRNTSCTGDADGYVEFYYNKNQITVDTPKIKKYNAVYTQTQSQVMQFGIYTDKFRWNFKDLAPNETRYIYIPAITNIPIGQDVQIDVKYYEECNFSSENITRNFRSRRYPHDPNYMIVNKDCTKENISNSQELIYTVGFFNDGEYFAHNVFVDDIINPGLDTSQITLVDYEELPVISKVGNTISFDFLGIDLPGTNQSDPYIYTYDQASRSFSFKICTKTNLTMCIDNYASIIFDTQPVFYTNNAKICPDPDCLFYETCGNSVVKKTALETTVFEEPKALEFSAYPNPTTDMLTVNIDFATQAVSEFHISLLDFSGRVVKTIHSAHDKTSIFNKTISLKDMASGMYFLTLETKEGKYTKKILKN
jgi:uncharacterized repeat protein (TIGR01451 family)